MRKKNIFLNENVYVSGRTSDLNKTEMIMKLDMAGAIQNDYVNRKTRYCVFGDEKVSKKNRELAERKGCEVLSFPKALELLK